MFLGLKYHYSSSHLHSTSNEKLTSLPVCGKTKARRSIKTFKELGWVKEINKGGVVFKSLKEIVLDVYGYTYVGGCCTITPRSLKVKTIEEELLRVLIKNKIQQFEYTLTAYHYSKSPKSLAELKKGERMAKKFNLRSEWEDRGACLSYLGWARELGISPTSAYRVIHRFALQRGISIKRNKVDTDIPNHFLKEMNDGNTYLPGCDGYLFQRLPNTYILG